MKHIPWGWLVALLAGLGLGLLYAWIISPVRYVDTTPDTLRADFKDQYRSAIAAAYAASGDLDRARARLALIGDPDPIQELTAQAQRMLAAGEPFEVIRQVAALASELQQVSPIRASETPAVITAGPPTSTPLPGAPQTESPSAVAPSDTPMVINTPTPRPTRTPTPTRGAPFVAVSQDTLCDPNLPDGLLQVTVMDSRRRQLAGVEIIMTWAGGEEHFFTGFKPELGNGYADYVMQPGVVYSVRIAEGGAPVPNLSAPSCQDASGQEFTGGLHLTFQQP